MRINISHRFPKLLLVVRPFVAIGAAFLPPTLIASFFDLVSQKAIWRAAAFSLNLRPQYLQSTRSSAASSIAACMAAL